MKSNLKYIIERQKRLKEYNLKKNKDTISRRNYLNKKYIELSKYDIWEDMIFNKNDIRRIKKCNTPDRIIKDFYL